jgi:hypothetical protein
LEFTNFAAKKMWGPDTTQILRICTKQYGEHEGVLSKHGFVIANFVDDYYAMSRELMMIAFTEEPADWIEWWLYEDVEEVIYHTKPKETNDPCRYPGAAFGLPC